MRSSNSSQPSVLGGKDGSNRHPAKSHKKVSFDVKPRTMNIARKSTFLRTPIPSPMNVLRRYKRLNKKHMLLKLHKIDTTGYEIPHFSMFELECSCLYDCARLLPVEEAISCARTSAVRNKIQKKTWNSMKPTSSHFNVDKKPTIPPSSNSDDILKHRESRVHQRVKSPGVLKKKTAQSSKGTLHSSGKPYYKKYKRSKLACQTLKAYNVMKSQNPVKSRKRVLDPEPEEKHVDFTLAEPTMEPTNDDYMEPTDLVESFPSISSPQDDMAKAEVEYELKLKETIEKMTGEPGEPGEPVKKKKK